MAANDQYSSPLFGMDLALAATGAPGTGGISASDTTGPVIGTVPVSTPYASSQVAANHPAVSVHAGDTSGMADDLAAHVSPIAPGPQSAYLVTGSGTGHTLNKHPNAGQ